MIQLSYNSYITYNCYHTSAVVKQLYITVILLYDCYITVIDCYITV